MEVVAGIDVGKVSLDVSVSEGPVLRFDNTAKSITRLLKHLKEQCTTMTVCEATGGYERLAGQPVAEGRDSSARGSPEPGAFLRPGLRLRSQDRS